VPSSGREIELLLAQVKGRRPRPDAPDGPDGQGRRGSLYLSIGSAVSDFLGRHPAQPEARPTSPTLSAAESEAPADKPEEPPA